MPAAGGPVNPAHFAAPSGINPAHHAAASGINPANNAAASDIDSADDAVASEIDPEDDAAASEIDPADDVAEPDIDLADDAAASDIDLADDVAEPDSPAIPPQEIAAELPVFPPPSIPADLTRAQAQALVRAQNAAAGYAAAAVLIRPRDLVFNHYGYPTRGQQNVARQRKEDLSSPATIQSLVTMNEGIEATRSRLNRGNVKRSDGTMDKVAEHRAIASSRMTEHDPSLAHKAAVCVGAQSGVCEDFAAVLACEAAGQLKEHQSLYVIGDSHADHTYVVLQDRTNQVPLIVGDAWGAEYAMLGSDNNFLQISDDYISVDTHTGYLRSGGNPIIRAQVHGAVEGRKLHDKYKSYLINGLSGRDQRTYSLELRNAQVEDRYFDKQYDEVQRMVRPEVRLALERSLTASTPEAQQILDSTADIHTVRSLQNMGLPPELATRRVNAQNARNRQAAAVNVQRFLGNP